MLMKMRVGSTIMLGAVVVKTANKKAAAEPAKQELDEKAHYKCKPSELPLYAPLHTFNKPKPISHPPKDSKVRQTIQCGVHAVRVQAFAGYNAVASQKRNFEEFIETGKAHSKFAIDYLNEPDNTMPRVGAIAIGGLSGFILALRGGFIRKLLYTGVGAGAIASICYPKEAEKYAQQGLVEAKKGVTIAYNFAVGVKPGDDVKASNLPKFPTNFSEITDLVSDLARSAKDAVFSQKK